MQLNVKLYKITWYSIICVALPGILLLYLHILTTTHLNPNRCGLFLGFWLGIFAIHKTWTSLAFWWRIDDKTGTLAYSVWCIVWVVQTQLFAENSNRGRKVSPEKLKKFTFQEISARKVEKIEKFEKSKSSHSRRFLLEKSKNSKSRKVRKIRKIRKVEKFTFQEISARKVEKFEKSKNSKNSKKSKSRKLFDFLTFCEKFCNFRAVRLPARRALSHFQTHPFTATAQQFSNPVWLPESLCHAAVAGNGKIPLLFAAFSVCQPCFLVLKAKTQLW